MRVGDGYQFLRHHLGLLFIASLKAALQQNYLYIKKKKNNTVDSWCAQSMFEGRYDQVCVCVGTLLMKPH